MSKLYENEKKHNRTQTCRNCGINGHLYKDCIHPIMSFGIICYQKKEDKINFLMIQRKDSLSFMEFIRGKYAINDIVYIKKLVNSMTKDEKYLLANNTFDEIWNYAWYQNNATNIKHTNEYNESKNKFEYLKDRNIIQKLVYNTFYASEHEQEWGFPKGRRKLKENDIDCAVREFCEETRLIPDDIEVLEDITPFEEIFFGTNEVLYKHTYYVARIKNNDIDISIDQNCIEQVREVRALKWYDHMETIQHIKQHNIERKNIVNKIHEILKEKEKIL